MQRLFCYADETGQDTAGTFFLVAVVLFGSDIETLRQHLIRAEKRSGKAARKWTHAPINQKSSYITHLLNIAESNRGLFRRAFFYQAFSNTTDYDSCTIEAITASVKATVPNDYKLTVIIDSLGKKKGRIYGSALRKQGVSVHKVRGLTHKSDEFIRLADALAGFFRDYLEGADYAQPLYREAKQLNLITRL